MLLLLRHDRLRQALWPLGLVGYAAWFALLGMPTPTLIFGTLFGGLLAFGVAVMLRREASEPALFLDSWHPGGLSLGLIAGISTLLNQPAATVPIATCAAILMPLLWVRLHHCIALPKAVVLAKAADIGAMAIAGQLPTTGIHLQREGLWGEQSDSAYAREYPLQFRVEGIGLGTPSIAVLSAVVHASRRPFVLPVRLKPEEWQDSGAHPEILWTPPTSAHARLTTLARGRGLLAKNGVDAP